MEEQKGAKRKNPLTTIAISQEYAKRMEKLIEKWGIDRKSFVEKSVEYFDKTGVDIRYYEVPVTPFERVAEKLDRQVEKVIFDSDAKEEFIGLFKQFAQNINAERPALENLKVQNKASEEEIQKLKDNILQLQKRINELESKNASVCQKISEYETAKEYVSGIWGKQTRKLQLATDCMEKIKSELSVE